MTHYDMSIWAFEKVELALNSYVIALINTGVLYFTQQYRLLLLLSLSTDNWLSRHIQQPMT